MFFGFMNKREKEVYNQYMYDLLKDKADIYGRVSHNDWNIADRGLSCEERTFITVKQHI